MTWSSSPHRNMSSANLCTQWIIKFICVCVFECVCCTDRNIVCRTLVNTIRSLYFIFAIVFHFEWHFMRKLLLSKSTIYMVPKSAIRFHLNRIKNSRNVFYSGTHCTSEHKANWINRHGIDLSLIFFLKMCLDRWPTIYRFGVDIVTAVEGFFTQ